MDAEYEAKLVRCFFEKRIRERIIFELTSSKTRKDAIGRLCHTYERVLIPKYMIPISKPNSDYIQIMNLLRSFSANDTCYAISFSSKIDGRYLPLEEALEEAVGFGFPTIISCIPEHLLYFEAEQCYGAPPRFIIKRD